ncbi:flippase domain protein, partial [Escherichia coli 96.0932]
MLYCFIFIYIVNYFIWYK